MIQVSVSTRKEKNMSKAKSKLTKASYLAQASNPDLSKVILSQLNRHGIPWSELIARPSDFCNASSGVNGFIYYDDTVKLAKRNLLLLIRSVHNFEQETGTPLENIPLDDDTNYLNFLAWFGLESVVFEIMNLLEE
jgi:hypothetical protein